VKIPSKDIERELFYINLAFKCNVTREQRRSDYMVQRSFYLFGAEPEEPPALYNKIYPHIDQLSSFIYSAETTRFSINLGAAVNPAEHHKIPVLTKALNNEWMNSNADSVFSMALNWALCYNSTFIKLIYKNGIQPYMVEPGAMGVLREDVTGLDRQEAVLQTYYITKSELYNRLYKHPKRDEIVARVNAVQHERSEIPEAMDRIITSSVTPTIYGNVNMDLGGMNKYKPTVAEDTVEMRELWVWNDDTEDYQCVTIADPDVVIYDRPGESLFLKGELPFIQIAPNPQYDYFWGQSEVQMLIFLQQMRNKRMTEILDLLSKQVAPPTALIGFTGILDEKNFALNRAAGLLATDSPNAKIEQLAPSIPNDSYREIAEIDAMFAEASGISSVLQGRGESGVRSAGHASQLARLGSSRAKKRALIVEDALEKVATLYLKLMQVYDNTRYVNDQNIPFIANQFTGDYVVKVDAHSNSPIFTEDLRTLAFNLFQAQAIDKESLLDLLEPPMKQLLIEKLRIREQKEAEMAAMQPPQAPSSPPSAPEMPTEE
jgi:hypothetical protein